MHLLCGFNEQLRYYCESSILDSPPKIDPSKNCWTHAKNIDPRKDQGKKFWTHAKKFDSGKSIFDPRNPRKNDDLRKKYFDPRNPRKYLTHATHTPTQHTLPRNPRDLANSHFLGGGSF